MIGIKVKNGEILSYFKPKESKEELFKKLKSKKSLSPSGFSSWSVCSGFLYSKPSRTTEAAQKGTLKHEKAYQDIIRELKGEKTGNKYSEFVVERIKSITNGTAWIEYPFLKEHNDRFYTLGFVDLAIMDGDTLILIDYKTGHSQVSPEKNLQLGLYHAIIDQKPKTTYYAIYQNDEYKSWVVDDDFSELVKSKVDKTLKTLSDDEVSYVYDQKSCDRCFNNSNCIVYYNEKNKIWEDFHEKND